MSYTPYKLGTHSAATMVPKFVNAKTYAATISEVQAALDLAIDGQPAGISHEELIAVAAYIWYSRKNARAYTYAPSCKSTDEYHAQRAYHKQTGVYPVCPQRLLTIKQSTITKYLALLG